MSMNFFNEEQNVNCKNVNNIKMWPVAFLPIPVSVDSLYDALTMIGGHKKEHKNINYGHMVRLYQSIFKLL